MVILKKMGFPNKWRNWISFYISIVRFSILVNGKASDCFSSLRGLRQGDSLSPLLFILVMETLSKLVIKGVEEGFLGFLNGFHISNPYIEGLLISHLFFADNTLIFCKPNNCNLGYLRCIVLHFEPVP